MGAEWSEPKQIKPDTWVKNIRFPEDQNLWGLWRIYKVSIKKDGFGVKQFQGTWYINYFYNVDDPVEFQQKLAKWERALNKYAELKALVETSESN